MRNPELLLYCTDAGKFVLKVKGEPEIREFEQIAEAFSEARRIYPKAPLVVYDAVGRVVMDTEV